MIKIAEVYCKRGESCSMLNVSGIQACQYCFSSEIRFSCEVGE